MRLERSFSQSNLHDDISKREMPLGNKSDDYYSMGLSELQRDSFIAKWHSGRNYKRNTDEIFDDGIESSVGDGDEERVDLEPDIELAEGEEALLDGTEELLEAEY